MSGHDKPQGFSWFKENTSLHGIPDIATSQRKVQRSIWFIAILLAFTGLVLQLSGITKSFVEGETGSRDGPYHPKELPTVMVCPTRLHLNDSVSEEDNLYIKGFFPLLHEEVLYGVEGHTGISPNAKVDEMLANVYNGSVSVMLSALLKKPLIAKRDHWHTTPPLAAVHEMPINTAYGTCFLIWSDMEITDRLAEYASYSFILEKGEGKYGASHPYRLFLGGEESVGVAPSTKGMIPLYGGNRYKISVRVYERQSYPGRLGSKCKNDYTQSQYRYCTMKLAADECVESPSRCLLYTPGRPGNIDPTDYRNTTFCNTKRSGEIGCIFALMKEADDQQGILQRCPHPCVEYAYDKTVMVENEPSKEEQVDVWISLDSLAMSKVTVEYPLMTTVDYLAAVGGSAGLFFGASILSFVQILVCLLGEAGEAKSCLKKTVHDVDDQAGRRQEVTANRKVELY